MLIAGATMLDNASKVRTYRKGYVHRLMGFHYANGITWKLYASGSTNMAGIKMTTPSAGSRKINATVVARARLGRKKLTPQERQERVESGYYNPDVRFMRVAGIRAEKIVDLCKGLRACANITVYTYTPEQVTLLLTTLDKAFQRVKVAFTQPSVNGKATIAKKRQGIFS